MSHMKYDIIHQISMKYQIYPNRMNKYHEAYNLSLSSARSIRCFPCVYFAAPAFRMMKYFVEDFFWNEKPVVETLSFHASNGLHKMIHTLVKLPQVSIRRALAGFVRV